MGKYILQVNSSGAWRNVLVGMTEDQMQEIKVHAASLAAIVGNTHKGAS